MRNKIAINLDTPCSENPADFQPTSNGGFCQSCQKEVIDFTQKTERELYQFFEQANGASVCGKFKQQQLGIVDPPFDGIEQSSQGILVADYQGDLENLEIELLDDLSMIEDIVFVGAVCHYEIDRKSPTYIRLKKKHPFRLRHE